MSMMNKLTCKQQIDVLVAALCVLMLAKVEYIKSRCIAPEISQLPYHIAAILKRRDTLLNMIVRFPV